MGELVRTEDIFLEMDRRDQQQIVAAMTGDVIQDLMYRVQGKDAISWAGINHICFFMGDIEVDKWVEWERIVMFEDRVYWCATVSARNTKYALSSLGTAEAPELKKVYEREGNNKIPVPGKPGEFKFHLEPDEHCRRKALSKAQRNAKRAVIPEALLKKWLAYFRDKKNGKEVDPPGQPKVVDADYKVTEKKAEKKKVPPKKRAPRKKASVKKPDEPLQTGLTQGKVNVDTVAYSLKAADIEVGTKVGAPYKEGDYIIVEAHEGLEDADHYQIFGALESMGAVWKESGHFGLWSMKIRE